MTNKEKAIYDKWKNIKVGKVWIVILLVLIWPFAVVYFFTRRWESLMTIYEVNEYHKYLEIKQKLKK